MYLDNNWEVFGKVISITEKRNGFWLYISGSLIRKDLYKSDKSNFDCYISKKILNDSTKIKLNSNINAKGRLVYKPDSCFFITEQLNN